MKPIKQGKYLCCQKKLLHVYSLKSIFLFTLKKLRVCHCLNISCDDNVIQLQLLSYKNCISLDGTLKILNSLTMHNYIYKQLFTVPMSYCLNALDDIFDILKLQAFP